MLISMFMNLESTTTIQINVTLNFNDLIVMAAYVHDMMKQKLARLAPMRIPKVGVTSQGKRQSVAAGAVVTSTYRGRRSTVSRSTLMAAGLEDGDQLREWCEGQVEKAKELSKVELDLGLSRLKGEMETLIKKQSMLITDEYRKELTDSSLLQLR